MSLVNEFVTTIIGIPEFKPMFKDGLTDAKLNVIEQKTGLTLPNDFKELYKLYNGQDYNGNCLFDYFLLNSFDDIMNTWETFKSLEEQFENDGIKSDPEIGIKDKWCNSKWLPFANTADGHSICIDYDPDETGTIGQVITYWYNSEERNLIAKSFKEFIETYLRNIQDGTYIFDVDGGAILKKDNTPMFGAE